MKKLKAWIQASRLRTLPLAFSTILMGAFIAVKAGSFDTWILIFALLTTLFLQVLSNLANDFGDFLSGVDNDERVGPKRTVQTGLITQNEMKWGLLICSLLAFASGLLLIYLSFGNEWTYALIFLLLGIGAIAAAIKYTIGKNPYGYLGLGDLFVLIFFGIVGVGGTYFLFTNEISVAILLPSLSLGLFSVGVLNVNNIRDIDSDRISGKNSIPVRLGKDKATLYHWIILLFGMILPIIYVINGDFRWDDLIFLLAYPMFLKNGMAVKQKKPAELDPYLKQLALATLFFVLLFGVGVIL